jgi:DNA-binding response OmpR family regulator
MSNQKFLLVVEDETILQLLLTDALEEAGYFLVLAGSATKALHELESENDRFHGIITDIRLGTGPSGWDVARRGRELSPGNPVIYMSGDSASDWSLKGVPGSQMLSKPFAIGQLTTAISTLLLQLDNVKTLSPGDKL